MQPSVEVVGPDPRPGAELGGLVLGEAVGGELVVGPLRADEAVTEVLKGARLLVECGGIGRTTFYRTTPYLAFIGTGFEHREAVSDWNPPEMRIPKPSDRRRKKGKGDAT